MIKKIGNKQYIARKELKDLLKRLESLQLSKSKAASKVYQTAGYSYDGGTGDEGWSLCFELGGIASGIEMAINELDYIVNSEN